MVELCPAPSARKLPSLLYHCIVQHCSLPHAVHLLENTASGQDYQPCPDVCPAIDAQHISAGADCNNVTT